MMIATMMMMLICISVSGICTPSCSGLKSHFLALQSAMADAAFTHFAIAGAASPKAPSAVLQSTPISVPHTSSAMPVSGATEHANRDAVFFGASSSSNAAAPSMPQSIHCNANESSPSTTSTRGCSGRVQWCYRALSNKAARLINGKTSHTLAKIRGGQSLSMPRLRVQSEKERRALAALWAPAAGVLVKEESTQHPGALENAIAVRTTYGRQRYHDLHVADDARPKTNYASLA